MVHGGLKEKRGISTYCNDLSSLELLASWTQRHIVSDISTVSPPNVNAIATAPRAMGLNTPEAGSLTDTGVRDTS